MDNDIITLCRRNLFLQEEDIRIILNYVAFLRESYIFFDKDIHISVLDSLKREGVIVYHQQPASSVSLYDHNIQGEHIDKQNEPGIIRTLTTGLISNNFSAITRGKYNIGQTATPLTNGEGRVIAAVTLEFPESVYRRPLQGDILEEASPELANILNVLNDDYGFIGSYINEGLVIFDEKENVIFANCQAIELYKKMGYINYLIGMTMKNVVFSPSIYRHIKLKKGDFSEEVNLMGFTLNVRCFFVKREGIAGVVMLIDDITNLRQQEKELVLRSVAIKESQHRIKNNLQMIASILQIQMHYTNSKEVRNLLSDDVERILSIATTHEMLSLQGLDQTISLKQMLLNIRSNLTMAYISSDQKFEITIEGDDIMMPSDIATNLALAVTELLCNSLKYAFTGRKYGKIELSITKGEVQSQIIIQDNGVGFDVEHMDCGLGLDIVKMTVEEKLVGNFLLTSDSRGTKAVILFNNGI